jgi:polyketide cyclase/dehydrase/lipid transport protein
VATKLTITAQVVVGAGAEQVFGLAVDWPRQREWIWATRVSGGHGTGAAVTGWTGVGPVGFTDTMVITAWDPPRRCVVAHTGRLVRGTGRFEVSPCGGPGPSRSRLSWTEDLRLPLPSPLGPLARLLAGPPARWLLNSSLRRFAKLLAPA